MTSILELRRRLPTRTTWPLREPSTSSLHVETSESVEDPNNRAIELWIDTLHVLLLFYIYFSLRIIIDILCLFTSSCQHAYISNLPRSTTVADEEQSFGGRKDLDKWITVRWKHPIIHWRETSNLSVTYSVRLILYACKMCSCSACNWRSIAIAMREETNKFCSGLEEHCNENHAG